MAAWLQGTPAALSHFLRLLPPALPPLSPSLELRLAFVLFLQSLILLPVVGVGEIAQESEKAEVR